MEHYTNNDYMKRCDVKSLYDKTFEVHQWADEIPPLRFKKRLGSKNYTTFWWSNYSFLSG